MKTTYSGADLRHIAMITMLIDHIAVCLLAGSTFIEAASGEGLYLIFRFIGRMAFSLYCFLLMEAFKHTRNRFRYLLTLLAMAVITEPIFDHAVYGAWNWKHQNVLFTFSVGFLLVWLLEKLKREIDSFHSYPTKMGVLLLGSISSIAVAGMFSLTFGFDYGLVGILYLAILFFMQNNQKAVTWIGAVLFSAEGGLGTLVAVYLIHKYNGELGKLKVPQQLYRIFYPLHLFVLFVFRKILLKI